MIRQEADDLEEIDIVIEDYLDKTISKEKCIKTLIGIWGRAGYSVSPDNALEYLNIVTKE
jgi:hypothetical protein